jgi:hypothetical protein
MVAFLSLFCIILGIVFFGACAGGGYNFQGWKPAATKPWQPPAKPVLVCVTTRLPTSGQAGCVSASGGDTLIVILGSVGPAVHRSIVIGNCRNDADPAGCDRDRGGVEC